ncbi:MAG: ModD protein [Coriobacteriaceae bacterium]|nr:ModD protein [Coriobacteriaceae bacterium]
MIRISDARLDYFMAEDVPYIDLTSEILGIGDAVGEMEYFSREACIVAGVEEVARLAKAAGCEVEALHGSGDAIEPEEPILRVRGRAGDLHQVWKVGLNLLDHLSAVATKTRAMVDAAHSVNPRCEVLTTRKSMPGCKDLLIEAVMVGGAFPHRLGLSETVLVFDHHMKFLGGFDEFVRRIPEFRSRCIEKKFFVEASPEQARVLAAAGVDGIQLDKVPVAELDALVKELRAIDPRVTLVAAGGVNPQNAAAYAATGVDGLATTALYTAKPLDMSIRMTAL